MEKCKLKKQYKVNGIFNVRRLIKSFVFFTIILIVISYTVSVEANSKANLKSTDLQGNINISSRIALVYDRASGKILYEKNGKKQTPMASTTKIMTAIVVLENAKLTDTVVVNAKAATIGGSRLGLKKGDKITVNDLLYGLMLRSGNDAAVALAIQVAGSIEKFADMMNKKALELGLKNSHFVVPHGLDNKEHYTTAYELAQMADYALKIDKFKEIVGTKSATIYIDGNAKKINNTNNLLGSISGVYGVKTGFTNGAGRCLVSACKRDNLDIITVVIGADTNNIRSKDTVKLIEYIYKEYEIVNIKDIVNRKFENWKSINENRIYVNKGTKNKVELYLEEMPYEKMAVKKDKKSKIDIIPTAIYYFEAPIEKNKIVGNIKLVVNSEVLEILNIYTKEKIEKKEIAQYFAEIISILY